MKQHFAMRLKNPMESHNSLVKFFATFSQQLLYCPRSFHRQMSLKGENIELPFVTRFGISFRRSISGHDSAGNYSGDSPPSVACAAAR
jgi:hypothetical protein